MVFNVEGENRFVVPHGTPRKRGNQPWYPKHGVVHPGSNLGQTNPLPNGYIYTAAQTGSERTTTAEPWKRCYAKDKLEITVDGKMDWPQNEFSMRAFLLGDDPTAAADAGTATLCLTTRGSVRKRYKCIPLGGVTEWDETCRWSLRNTSMLNRHGSSEESGVYGPLGEQYKSATFTIPAVPGGQDRTITWEYKDADVFRIVLTLDTGWCKVRDRCGRPQDPACQGYTHKHTKDEESCTDYKYEETDNFWFPDSDGVPCANIHLNTGNTIGLKDLVMSDDQFKRQIAGLFDGAELECPCPPCISDPVQCFTSGWGEATADHPWGCAW